MKVIVFGGAGFLGSHICDKLSDSGHEVIIYDIKKSVWLRSDQEMIVGDILNIEEIEDAVKGCDVVYNFAGLADIDDAKDKPLQTVQLNILGNVNIMEACRKEGVKRYIFASSVYVYSDSGSFYRASKKACEDYVELYNKRYGLEYTILRYGTLYGPRSDERNAIFRFVKSALREKKIEYTGDIAAKREYIHVFDAAQASVEVLDSKFSNQNITLTGSQTYYVKELLEMINEVLGNEIEIIHNENKSKTAHYKLTPYNFTPKCGKKFIPSLQVDIGQGLLNVVEEIYHSENL